MSDTEREPTIAELLVKILPEHTHITGSWLGAASWTWTTSAGVWRIEGPSLFTTDPWMLSTPYGKLRFPAEQFRWRHRRLLGVLGGVDLAEVADREH